MEAKTSDSPPNRYSAIQTKLATALAKAETKRLEEIMRKERANVALQEAFERVALLTLDLNIDKFAHSVVNNGLLQCFSVKPIGDAIDLDLLVEFHKKRCERSQYDYSKASTLRVSIPFETPDYPTKSLVAELITDSLIRFELSGQTLSFVCDQVPPGTERLPGSDL